MGGPGHRPGVSVCRRFSSARQVRFSLHDSPTNTLTPSHRVLAQVELDFNSVERIVEYLGVPQEAAAVVREKRPPAAWPSTSGELVVEDLVVKYAPHLPAVLKKLSFYVKPAEKIGIVSFPDDDSSVRNLTVVFQVGRTGSGKSTLAMSLLRIVEPTGGHIM